MDIISNRGNDLRINQGNIGDYYALYKGGKVIWSGKDEKHINIIIEKVSDE
ncbi:hypothetical protein PDK32_27520 [Bacillus cereus]|nr:hypothetical protein [Bacillus cereus]